MDCRLISKTWGRCSGRLASRLHKVCFNLSNAGVVPYDDLHGAPVTNARRCWEEQVDDSETRDVVDDFLPEPTTVLGTIAHHDSVTRLKGKERESQNDARVLHGIRRYQKGLFLRHQLMKLFLSGLKRKKRSCPTWVTLIS